LRMGEKEDLDGREWHRGRDCSGGLGGGFQTGGWVTRLGSPGRESAEGWDRAPAATGSS
jgi:hypothetical protein